MREKSKIEEAKKTFANPKSASFTVPFASTKIFAHLISLQYRKERGNTSKINYK